MSARKTSAKKVRVLKSKPVTGSRKNSTVKKKIGPIFLNFYIIFKRKCKIKFIFFSYKKMMDTKPNGMAKKQPEAQLSITQDQ